MFKCTGICSKCGRCKNYAMMSEANDRKTKMLAYPKGFKIDEGGRGLGAAFDIGTTTVVGMLWNMESGEQMATVARTNPQNEFGMDVISRIAFCEEDEANLSILRKKIIGCINEITEELCEKAKKNKNNIMAVSLCGNTTMSHIFGGYSPMTLALAPFVPAYNGTLRMSADEAMLHINKKGTVAVLPNISGHVGGDITAGIVASRALDMEGLTAFIDIGTNGEIVLTDGEKTYACSTAAGPAFEGSAIKYGMRAANGAIEKVRIEEGEVLFRTIGEIPAQGICGSGIIDAISQMLDAKLIDKKGRITAPKDWEKCSFDERLCERLTVDDKERQFVLVSKDDDEDIVITQNDVREVQLAKGAIKAGIEIMLKKIGKTVHDLDRIIVAGAFGNYIDKESAVRVGVLPNIPTDKIILAGNTAGVGVSMALTSKAEMALAEKIPKLIKRVELAEDADFQMIYIGSMGF